MHQKLLKSILSLLSYIEKEEFKGYDPYDALNSPYFDGFPFHDKKARILATQALRRLPVNIRPWLKIAKGYNPKGLGLFLSGYCKMYSVSGEQKYLNQIYFLASLLEKTKSKGYHGCSWGYNFPWQNRYCLFPMFTPTIVNTSFIGHALLDAYELIHDKTFYAMAQGAGQFIQKDLKISYADPSSLCLSYTPHDQSRVYNANILGASLLARLNSIHQDHHSMSLAQKMVHYVVQAQNGNGSWFYGAEKTQRWIDIHHTGFVLDGLYDFILFSGQNKYNENLINGMAYFAGNFFLPGGRPKLWHHRDYPTDIHCVQAIVTLTKLSSLSDHRLLLDELTSWIIRHMQDPSGYFYYQFHKYYMNKIPYMRWSQAWAFHALTTYYRYLIRILSL